MKKLYLFHKQNYKPMKIRENYKKKEFLFSVSLIIIFISALLTYGFLHEGIGKKSSIFLWITAITSMILMVIYITHLERNTEYFVNNDLNYKSKLENYLNLNLNIKNTPQLDLVIKSLTEERNKSIKIFGVSLPYIAIGLTTIILFLNKGDVNIEESAIYLGLYLFFIMLLHTLLKIVELFFNSYADNISTLINFLTLIQLEWLNTEDKKTNILLNKTDEEYLGKQLSKKRKNGRKIILNSKKN